MNLTRRKFLTGLLAAPLVVKAEVLMPVQKIITPEDGAWVKIEPHPGGIISHEHLVEELVPGLHKIFRVEYAKTQLEGVV